jgi:hypothetical protein
MRILLAVAALAAISCTPRPGPPEQSPVGPCRIATAGCVHARPNHAREARA